MDYLKKINLDKIRNAAEDAINQARPKTDVEARIYEALSHKNWGSSSTLMNEIARDTFDYEKYSTITRIIWESLSNQRPAAWRVVFKAMTLLEHLIKNGSERCVDDARNHSHILRSLFNFNYYEGTTDRGIGVREKSKQIVELLGDDERVREERTKARQLREKFGGNLGGVSSGGGGGGGGYGGSSYAGYGGGGSGYGDSGIGSSGYADSGIGSSTSGFSGRYNDNETASSPAKSDNVDTATPTFATIPEKKKKKSKKTKKKKDKGDDDEVGQNVPTSAPPEIDLLAMDDPVVQSNDSEFDAFQSSTTATATVDNSGFDAFGISSSQPTNNAPSFDAFGSMQSANNHSDGFDAFSSTTTMASKPNNNFNNVNDMFGNMSMNTMSSGKHFNNQNSTGNNNIMSGSRGKNSSNDDDDFGDFADGTINKSSNKTVSSDPLANLISLDGLTKNSKKEDKTNEPIYFNEAAKHYNDHKDQIKAETSKLSIDMAFSGVDGLNKISSQNQTMMFKSNYQGNSNTPVMNSNSNVMMMNSGMGSFGMPINNNMSSNGISQMGMMQNSNTSNMKSMNAMAMGNSMGHSMMTDQQKRNFMSQGGMMGGQQGNNGNNMMGGMGNHQSVNMNMMGGQPMGGGF